ncbi:MAG: hypothetical protein ABI663_14645 [Chryseolinea sp.]
MKTLQLLLVCMVAVLYSRAQDNEDDLTPDQAQFERAMDVYEEGDLASAASEFRKFMVEYSESPLVARAHYNVAYISFFLKEFGTAKLIFREILAMPYNEQDPNGLMEPYTLYKHHSCRMLAEMALEEQDYSAAEKYIHQFDKVYPYQHFCGNEWAAYDMYLTVMRARVYEGRNQIQKMLEVLLPYTFTNSLASNNGVLDKLVEVLEKNYSKEVLRQEFARSFASLAIKQNKKETHASVLIYGVKVEVEDSYFSMDEENRTKPASETERYQNIVKGNKLFKKFL